jgi:hypothetical protein
MRAWQPARTMPPEQVVEVRTVKGLVSHAIKSGYKYTPAKGKKPGQQHCWKYPRYSDLMAVEWRPWQI